MLKSLELQNFRNYSKRNFDFFDKTTLIVGPNAVGKTNILEAIYLLATGKSFRAEKENELIENGNSVARILGKSDQVELEIVWDDRGRFQKLFRVNGVGKRLVDFVGNLRAVLFSPTDIELVTDGPGIRRNYLDGVLSQIFKEYRVATTVYGKAVRQRNKILFWAREQGLGAKQLVEQLDYWNNLLIENGKIIHQRRKEFLDFVNDFSEKPFPIRVVYDHSVISSERLSKYAQEELAAAVTLVGPHRDDFTIFKDREERISDQSGEVKSYGSRGEQRLAVFTLKTIEIEYISKVTGERPILLLDDIFSELDVDNRHLTIEQIGQQQTIITATEKTMLKDAALKGCELIELG